MDLSLIVLFSPLLFPVACAVALWLKLTSRGPILFKQTRIGSGGEPFTIYKFRSMEVDAATNSHEEHVQNLIRSGKPMTKLDNLGDSRLVPGGAFLRSVGLDELPQLFNVLRGEMSLVGPRPCLPREFEGYSVPQRERFKTLPGLTGLWQVNGKNRTSFSEMVALDVHYLRNRSLWMDVKILAKTPFAILVQLCDSAEIDMAGFPGGRNARQSSVRRRPRPPVAKNSLRRVSSDR